MPGCVTYAEKPVRASWFARKRRRAATYFSRSGVPIEIASKVILRHANLSTIHGYLGKISDTETTKWIENLYGGCA